MEHLWEDPSTPLSVREVHTRISVDRDIAYTTVLTVLDRLAKKHLVTRQLDGRSWLYSPVRTRAQMVVDDILASIHAGDPRQRRELLGELFARLLADESLPPCAPLWAHVSHAEVTLAGDRNGDQS